MKDIIDIIFKLVILLLLCIVVFYYISNSSMGRYQFGSLSPRFVIDTKTGDVYRDGELQYSIGQKKK